MIKLYLSECLPVLKSLPDNSVDSIVTDPPYGLSKQPDMIEVMRHWMAGDDYQHTGGGFMGKAWDSFVPGPSVWRECMRVLKPGGYLLAFSGSRTYDLMALAVRLAGFEIRDQLMWVYGSGFPKSLDVSKAIDKIRIEDVEPIRVVCRAIRAAMDGKRVKSRDLVQHFGGCHPRLIDHWAARDADSQPALPTWEQWLKIREVLEIGAELDPEVCRLNQKKGQWSDDAKARGTIDATGGLHCGTGNTVGAFTGKQMAPDAVREDAKKWQGWGTALKPAHEPIVMARKPLIGTVAANVLAHGVGALNVDGCRVATSETLNGGSGGLLSTVRDGKDYPSENGFEQSPNGRWPANFLHDGSEEVIDPLGDAARYFYCAKASANDRNEGCDHLADHSAGEMTGGRKEGSAGLNSPRAGAGRTSGAKNIHPTVKPAELMRWLVRLVTPPGGTVLDPFMGSGSTGKAAIMESAQFVGIEMGRDYMEIAHARISHAAGDQRVRVVIRQPANDNTEQQAAANA